MSVFFSFFFARTSEPGMGVPFNAWGAANASRGMMRCFVCRFVVDDGLVDLGAGAELTDEIVVLGKLLQQTGAGGALLQMRLTGQTTENRHLMIAVKFEFFLRVVFCHDHCSSSFVMISFNAAMQRLFAV